MLAFIDRWRAEPEGPHGLVVQCEQGVSRSAAVARFAAERHGLEFRREHPHLNDRAYRLLEEAARR
jgi:predicted protein tyrosine phosphatase